MASIDKVTALKTHVYNHSAPPLSTVIVTVLYSVPFTQLETYKDCLLQAIEKINHQKLDIEHALFGNLDSSKLNNVSVLGVRGIVASSCTEWNS